MTFSVLECEQRSPAWFQARVGLLTATGAAAMLSQPKKKDGEDTVGKSELRLRLALETLYGEAVDDDPYESGYMRRGRELESDALDAYEAVTGEIVQRVGFLKHDTLPIGCSPDGMVGNFESWLGGVEMKCPKFTTHFAYLRKGTLPTEYAAQIWHSLFVTGLPWWDFCSYCPELKGPARLFRVRVARDEQVLDSYALAFSLFWSEVEQVMDTLRALSAPEVTHGPETE